MGTLESEGIIENIQESFREVLPSNHVLFKHILTFVVSVCDGEKDCILKDVFGVLESIAPDGTFFGACLNDETDFGFWLNEEKEKMVE